MKGQIEGIFELQNRDLFKDDDAIWLIDDESCACEEEHYIKELPQYVVRILQIRSSARKTAAGYCDIGLK